jgi:GH18 family chitinase
MKTKHLYTFNRTFVVLFLLLTSLTQSFSQTKVVGYLPTWGNVNQVDFTKITHLNIAFGNPNSAGDILLSDNFSTSSLATIVQAAHAQNVKVYLSIAGGAVPETTRNNYAVLLSNATNINNFVSKLVNYAVANNLDGIDVDIEGNLLDNIAITSSNYETFVTQLGTSLRANNKGMTAALGNWFAGLVTNAAMNQFDFISVMAYDATGPWQPNQPGPHSTLAFAQSSVQYWLDRGLPSQKTVLGVPFYGYGFGADANEGISFADIISRFPGSENQDQVGNTIYYNGIPTIKAKTEYALQKQLGGIMIWHLTQDATGSKSLLLAIDQVVKATSNTAPTVSITAPTTGYSTTAGSTIEIQASASDADGTVSKVEFFRGTTKLGEDLTAPYQYSWTNVAAGTYAIQAKATDNRGAVTTSTSISITVQASTSTNLALNKPVTVSSVEVAGFEGDLAVDGNAGTRWSSGYADPQYLAVDLGARYAINRVKITWEAAYGKNYQIQTSNDNVTWTTIKTITNNTDLSNDHTDLNGTGRYIRIYGTARGTVYGYSIFELEVYGSAAARLAMKEESVDQSIVAFPNPTDAKVSLQLSSYWQEGAKIALANALGKVLVTEPVQNAAHTIDLSLFPAGVYFLTISTPTYTTTRRIVKR